MLNPQYEEKIQVTGTLFLYKEPVPSDLKTLRSTFLCKQFPLLYYWFHLKTNIFKYLYVFF